MTEAEQSAAIEDVIRQARLVRLSRQRSIKCPFCGEYNMKRVAGDPPEMWIRPGKSPFCCDHFECVANAIVGRFLESDDLLTEDSDV